MFAPPYWFLFELPARRKPVPFVGAEESFPHIFGPSSCDHPLVSGNVFPLPFSMLLVFFSTFLLSFVVKRKYFLMRLLETYQRMMVQNFISILLMVQKILSSE